MPRERIPEDPDFTPDWKKTLVGLLITAGVIVLFVAGVIFVTASLTAFTYQQSTMPPDVEAVLNASRQTSYALFAIGGGLVVIGLIERR